MCYQKHLKTVFGSDWKNHYSDQDCATYVVGNKTPVWQLDKNGNEIKMFGSLAEAERFVAVKNGSKLIGKVCSGERKSAYGYMWRYA